MFRLIALLLAIIMCAVSVAAVYYNKDPLLIDLYIIQFTNIPLGISLFLSMMFGVLVATFFIIGIVFSLRKKYKNLKKDHELINKEVQNLRRIPIQE
tara:strand:- start:2428 stop:2718 length:291 start_codon:yes stop_codon:yes gene_type:complete